MRCHLVPEESVVVVPASAVADSGSSSEGISLKVPNINSRLVLHGVVDVCHVSVVVLKVRVGGRRCEMSVRAAASEAVSEAVNEAVSVAVSEAVNEAVSEAVNEASH